jgi:hypothetical protein
MAFDLVFKDLIGEEVTAKNGTITIITDSLLNLAENKLASKRRQGFIKEKNPDQRLTNRAILEKHVTAEDIIRNIPSVAGLNKRNNDRANGELPDREKEVKFDDIRNMDLSLENWETYTPEERKFAQGLLSAYNDYYDLNAPNDKTGIYDVIDLEVRMQTIRLFIRVTKKKDESAEYDAKLKELRVQWSKALDDLNLKKKQRDVAKPKPTDTTNDIGNAIKSLDEMQAETAQRKATITKKKLAKK